jgi:Holliday junction resolvasome RuvABC endonuclease subunit
MVRNLLSIKEDITSTHASDALALAVCHAHHLKMLKHLKQADEASGKGKRAAQ